MGGEQRIHRFEMEGASFELEIGGAFAPTDTTRLLIEASLPLVQPSTRLLDLGCGTGVVGLVISKLKSLPFVYLSDVHDASLEVVRANFAKADAQFEFRHGNLFAPWKGEKFDLIIDDVSGVAEPIAKISRWFGGVPCDSGTDGTALVCRVIDEAAGYLHEHGKLLFPVISLSGVEKILKVARTRFARVSKLGTKEWPMPQELLRARDLLEALEKAGQIRLIRRFGMLLGSTEVYVAEGALP